MSRPGIKEPDWNRQLPPHHQQQQQQHAAQQQSHQQDPHHHNQQQQPAQVQRQLLCIDMTGWSADLDYVRREVGHCLTNLERHRDAHGSPFVVNAYLDAAITGNESVEAVKAEPLVEHPTHQQLTEWKRQRTHRYMRRALAQVRQDLHSAAALRKSEGHALQVREVEHQVELQRLADQESQSTKAHIETLEQQLRHAHAMLAQAARTQQQQQANASGGALQSQVDVQQAARTTTSSNAHDETSVKAENDMEIDELASPAPDEARATPPVQSSKSAGKARAMDAVAPPPPPPSAAAAPAVARPPKSPMFRSSPSSSPEGPELELSHSPAPDVQVPAPPPAASKRSGIAKLVAGD